MSSWDLVDTHGKKPFKLLIKNYSKEGVASHRSKNYHGSKYTLYSSRFDSQYDKGYSKLSGSYCLYMLLWM